MKWKNLYEKMEEFLGYESIPSLKKNQIFIYSIVW